MIKIFSVNSMTDKVLIANIIGETNLFYIINKLVSVYIDFDEEKDDILYKIYPYYSDILYSVSSDIEYKLYKSSILICSDLSKEITDLYLSECSELENYFIERD